MELSPLHGIMYPIIALAVFGGTYFLTPDSLDHTYICTTSLNWTTFDRISSTGVTGYYMNDTREVGKVCKGGQWISIVQYANEHGVDPIYLLESQTINIPEPIKTDVVSGIEYCHINGCIGE